jgi:hypothetical protein
MENKESVIMSGGLAYLYYTLEHLIQQETFEVANLCLQCIKKVTDPLPSAIVIMG